MMIKTQAYYSGAFDKIFLYIFKDDVLYSKTEIPKEMFPHLGKGCDPIDVVIWEDNAKGEGDVETR